MKWRALTKVGEVVYQLEEKKFKRQRMRLPKRLHTDDVDRELINIWASESSRATDVFYLFQGSKVACNDNCTFYLFLKYRPKFSVLIGSSKPLRTNQTLKTNRYFYTTWILYYLFSKNALLYSPPVGCI